MQTKVGHAGPRFVLPGSSYSGVDRPHTFFMFVYLDHAALQIVLQTRYPADPRSHQDAHCEHRFTSAQIAALITKLILAQETLNRILGTRAETVTK